VDISKIVADRIQLPDGRYVAYCEWGATNDTAQHSVLVLHDFLSSRLAGWNINFLDFVTSNFSP
jgi:hypothetical protein